MQYEVTFKGGPKDGERKTYPTHVRGELYAYREIPNGVWHYYFVDTRGTAKVPYAYLYIGASEEQFDDVKTAKEHFSNPQE